FVRRGGRATRRPLPAGDPGLAAFEARGGVLSRDEVEEAARLRPNRDALRSLFDALDAVLLVPLLRRGQPAGLLAVGGKSSGRPFSADDVDVLTTLANQTAIALANAAALEQLRDAQENLARAEHLAAIGELSAGVAHGIRTPLTSVRRSRSWSSTRSRRWGRAAGSRSAPRHPATAPGACGWSSPTRAPACPRRCASASSGSS